MKKKTNQTTITAPQTNPGIFPLGCLAFFYILDLLKNPRKINNNNPQRVLKKANKKHIKQNQDIKLPQTQRNPSRPEAHLSTFIDLCILTDDASNAWQPTIQNDNQASLRHLNEQ